MKTYRYFIGANNDTKRVERGKVEALTLAEFSDGFTMTDGRGVWRGGSEPMIIVELVTNDKKRAIKLAQTYKTELKQEAVLLQVLSGQFSFV